jgi:hypothetical protein
MSKMKQMKVRFVGMNPVMFHNDRLSMQSYDPYAKELKRLNEYKKRKGVNKEEVEHQIAAVEWEGGLYFDHKEFGKPASTDGIGVYVPSKMVRACIQNGARMERNGKKIERALIIRDTMFKLHYEGPQDFDELLADPNFMDIRSVMVGRSKVPRARPIFPSGWYIDAQLFFLEDGLNEAELIKSTVDAGLFHGLGDARQLGYGRFQVQILEKAKAFKGGFIDGATDATQAH